MSRDQITQDDLDVLLPQIEAEAVRPEGLTLNEIAELWGCTYDVARKRIQAAIRQKLWRCTGGAERTNMAGRKHVSPVYAPVKGKK